MRHYRLLDSRFLNYQSCFLGWFLLLSSVLGFLRVKRWERGIRESTPRPPPTTEEVAADGQARARFLEAFPEFDSPPQSPRNASSHERQAQADESVANPIQDPNDPRAQHAHLMRLLRESGFI